MRPSHATSALRVRARRQGDDYPDRRASGLAETGRRLEVAGPPGVQPAGVGARRRSEASPGLDQINLELEDRRLISAVAGPRNQANRGTDQDDAGPSKSAPALSL